MHASQQNYIFIDEKFNVIVLNETFRKTKIKNIKIFIIRDIIKCDQNSEKYILLLF